MTVLTKTNSIVKNISGESPLRRLTPPILFCVKHPVLRWGNADLLLKYADKIGWDPQSYHLTDRLDRGVGVEEKLGGVFDA